MKSPKINKFITILSFVISSAVFLGNAYARNFAKRFDQTLNGTILSTSNVLISCDSANALCSGAQNFVGPVYTNGPFKMVNIDVDGDLSTFNSSSADISFPSNSIVVFAGLYWGDNLPILVHRINFSLHQILPEKTPLNSKYLVEVT